MPTGGPLAGLRILAVEQYGAGPFGTLQLADLGAEVIKIESPGAGDVGRYVPPYAEGDDSLFFQSLNRSKRSVTLDLRHPEGTAAFRRLVRTADAVFSNVRGSRPDEIGLTFEALCEINPRIVCCHLTGFGRVGPRRDDPGYDYIVQALTGFAAMGGEPEGPPARAGVSVVDFASGYVSALAILAGIHHARQTGRGGDTDVSLFSTAISMLNYLASWHLNRGYEPRRLPGGAHPSIVPSQLFATADGWLMVMCQKEKFFAEMVRALGLGRLEQDERYSTMAARLQNRESLIELLTETLRTRGTAEWLSLLNGKVPVAPVNSVAQGLRDPQVEALGLLLSYEHPAFGRLTQVASPIAAQGACREPRPAPALGADTEWVLSQYAEMSPDEIRALREAGAI